MKKKYIHKEEFVLESLETIQNLELTYHVFGKINEHQDNIIWVFHAISADSNVLEWWPGLFGKGKFMIQITIL
jgi:homoserine O-acetyltransferase